MSTAFAIIERNLGNGNVLTIIDIEEITSELKKVLDTNLVKICEGNSNSSLKNVKARLAKFLSKKVDSNIEMGAIAEFFIHLYLNESGHKQQCLYLNLEEGSIKKGFDGYYSILGEEWILESKSGSINTKGISHGSKIKESYEDLKSKLAGNGNNNPWRNAYNHASHLDVAADSSIIKKIKEFSDDYDALSFKKIEDLNVMPGSTIFLDGTWKNIDPDEIEAQMVALIGKSSFKKVRMICVNKKSLDLFRFYLNDNAQI